MQSLAHAEAWDGLAALQLERAKLIAAISATTTPASLPEAEQLDKIIRLIQACDEEIREYLLPCKENIATLLKARPTSPPTTP